MHNVAEHSSSKLNKLQRELPEGFVVDASWLSHHRITSSLRSHYVAAGWLESPARRVYTRPNASLHWERVVLSLQTLLNYPLVVGGRTALEMQGYSHYLSTTVREVHLYGEKRPPTWLDDLKLDVTFHYHNSLRLFLPSIDDPMAPQTHGGRDLSSRGASMADAGGISRPLTLSSPERAVLELLDELPKHESFHQVDVVMEGLANLSPSRLQKLLAECRSVKVKRLFFFFADRHGHAWLNRLDRSKIALGTGKRVLVRGGKLDQRYQITVPEDIHGVS